MTKILTIISSVLLFVPAISFAQVGHINGNGNADQKLATTSGATTMHMQIVTDQGQHTFRWDNTPWRVDQGGTGLTSVTPGALIYGDGTSPFAMVQPGTLGQVLQFNGSIPQWVATSSLGIVAQLVDGGVINGLIAANGGLQLFNYGSVDFYSDEGDTFIGGINVTENGVYYFGNARGNGVLDFSDISENTRIFTFPDFSGTFGFLEADQKWTGTNAYSKGGSATTTVNFGEMGDSTSHACFSTKNTDGDDISFYFVGTAMVVEANTCR